MGSAVSVCQQHDRALHHCLMLVVSHKRAAVAVLSHGVRGIIFTCFVDGRVRFEQCATVCGRTTFMMI